MLSHEGRYACPLFGLVVVMDGGVCEGGVAGGIYVNRRPLFLCAGEIYVGQSTATIECTISNTRHTVPYYNVNQASVSGERITANARDTVGNDNARQIVAMSKRLTTNTLDVLAEGDTRHI